MSNDLKIGIHSFPASHLTLEGRCGKQAGKFTCCAVGRGTWREFPILVWWTDSRRLLSELVIAH